MKIALMLLSAAFLGVAGALAAPEAFGGPPPTVLGFGLAFGTALLAGLAAALFPGANSAKDA